VSTATSQFGYRRLGGASFVGLGMLITLLIHGAILGLAYWSQIGSEPPPEATRDLMVTQLVVLGKPREKFWLPRIVQPPKPKVEQPSIKVADDPNTPTPPPKEAPKPEDKDVNKDLRNALKRAQALARAAAEEEAEGSATGSAQGTATQAQQGDEYATLVHNAIKNHWTAPAGLLNDAQLASLVADVRVRIADDGTLENPRLQKGSGNDLFDDSCVQAVKATGKVPPPPAAVRAKFQRGLLITFDGKNLAR
jgi:TonB family protein